MSDDQVSTTKLSSRGQVVIPEEIRKNLGLEAGARFVVLGKGDTVVLKRISPPTLDEFEDLLARARTAAAEVGLGEVEIDEVIRRVREREGG